MREHLPLSRIVVPQSRFAPIALLLLGLAGLPGCDTVVPDRLNPFAKEVAVEPETPIDTSKVPGEDEPTPNLASVPDRPAPSFSADQRKALVQGLVADRENAVYSDGSGPGRAAKSGEAPEVTPAKRASVAAQDIAPAAGGEAARLGTIVFPAGSVELPTYAANIIGEIAEAHKSSDGAKLKIIGHAGAQPQPDEDDQAVRMQLAAGRAQAVAIALMQNGVPRDSLVTTARPNGVIAEDTGGARADIYLDQ